MSRATGFLEVAVALTGCVLPVFLIHPPRTPFGLAHQPEILAVMCAGGALSLWGYLTLNRAFSLLPEARQLRTTGPYRWVRHPVYAGNYVTVLAVLVWRYSHLNLALVVVFLAVQTHRARLEEAKLAAAFPAYERYKARTGMFLPGW